MTPSPLSVGTLSVQLFTFRDAYAADPDGTIALLAGLGFQYVEPYGHVAPDAPLAPRLEALHALKRRLDTHGLQVSSRHVAAPFGPHAGTVLDEMDALPTELNVVPGPMLVEGFGLESFRSAAGVERFCAAMNDAAARAAARGYRLGYHNHWWEFEPLDDGQTPFDLMLRHLDPAVFFELDVYWALTAGLDVPALLRRLGERVPALHLKDGPGTPELTAPHVSLGDGALDYRAVIAAAPHARWHVLELDNAAGDPFEIIARSAQTLIADGLSRWTPA